MISRLNSLQGKIQETFTGIEGELAFGELTLSIPPSNLFDVCMYLREAQGFEQLMDVAGIDYLHYGEAEWQTSDASGEGFSRGVEASTAGRFTFDDAPDASNSEKPRFAVAYHLLSIQHNYRVRLVVRCEDNAFPVVPSVVPVWTSANWFEREAFDLFGIVFEGHPDLRRLLTDYGFVGHPFRKDFPMIGNVEMTYDEEQRRVVYQPVSITPRVLVPRVIRKQRGED